MADCGLKYFWLSRLEAKRLCTEQMFAKILCDNHIFVNYEWKMALKCQSWSKIVLFRDSKKIVCQILLAKHIFCRFWAEKARKVLIMTYCWLNKLDAKRLYAGLLYFGGLYAKRLDAKRFYG